MDLSRQLDREFHWLVVRNSGKLELCHFAFSTSIPRQHEIAVDDHAHREARPDCDGRLDVEIAAHDLLAGLIEAVGAAAPECRQDGAVVVGSTELRADAE